MLFVHFTPVKNIKHIKHMGIKPHRGRVYLFPFLRGEKSLVNTWSAPLWWKTGTAKHDKKMAKVIVKLPPDEKVIYIDWSGEPTTVRELGKILRKEVEEGERCIREKEAFEFKKAKENHKEYVKALSLAYWLKGCEVVYRKPIPPKWIVNIFVYSGSDLRFRQYRREKYKKKENNDS